MSVLRLLGSEGNLGSASNVGFAKLVRVLNNKHLYKLSHIKTLVVLH
jgi:hypothetical protein